MMKMKTRMTVIVKLPTLSRPNLNKIMKWSTMMALKLSSKKEGRRKNIEKRVKWMRTDLDS